MRSITGAALALGCLLTASAAQADEPLPPDHTGVKASIDMTTPNLFLFDDNFATSSRIHVLSGTDLAYKGMISSGYIVQPWLPPDGKTLYMAVSYYSRYTSGNREDVIETVDVATLTKTGEIAIPPKHAMTGPLRPMVQGSADGRWLFVQNALPATSVTVVDLTAKKAVGEIPTPGCWSIYPSASVPNRFSALCGDGTMATYTLNAEGTKADRKSTHKFFDVDTEPLFAHAERDGDSLLFISFTGTVYRVNIEGEVALVQDRFPINVGVKGNWRPGGFQLLALHQPSRILYVLMHKDGKEGSHKQAADEIWAVDLASQKVIARTPSKAIDVLTVSKDASAVLYGIAPEEPEVVRYVAAGKPGHLKETGSDKVGTWMTQAEVR